MFCLPSLQHKPKEINNHVDVPFNTFIRSLNEGLEQDEKSRTNTTNTTCFI